MVGSGPVVVESELVGVGVESKLEVVEGSELAVVESGVVAVVGTVQEVVEVVEEQF